MSFPGNLTNGFTDLERNIWEVLHDKGPLSTAEVAAEVGADTRTVYQICKKLEKKFRQHMRSTTRTSDRRLYFFPATGDVLTQTNQQHISKVMQDLRQIAQHYPVKRGTQLPPKVKSALKRDYKRYLQGLAERMRGKKREQILAFEGQLMAVLSGTRKSDVVGMTGLRSFRPKVRVWELLPDAPARLGSQPRK